ncbi:MAG: DNA polymerase III subunit alpha [Candidatus Omnitrophica bacterium]|nr:DNA polymerase III subunit alpha [Candidatus Omnitrophota bacterium]MBU4478907.1 DNA polymerase III subunit alpha [Candidatus Omnitrophota bacterium]MCG2704368.1 DNA polymerase III subunit alpha [Candidatus Omnitrophota bacterium]
MKHSDFVHLHVHSQYSLLDGACLVSKLIDLAHEMHMPALTITDHGNIFGAIEFYSEAMKKGVKPIIGCETYVAKTSRHKRGELGEKEQNHHLSLLIKDEEGYKNLIRLVSIAYREGFYYKPRIDKEVLSQYSKGLVGMSGCLKGEIASLLLAGQEKQAYDVARQFQEIFDKDSFYLEIMDHNLPEQRKVNKALVKLSKDLNIPLVATNDVHYLKKEMSQAHEVLLCLQTQTTLDDQNRMRLSSDEFYFKSPEEMKKLFSELPESISNTIRITEMCNLELDFKTTHLPHYNLPDGASPVEVLRQICLKNIPERCRENEATAKERLEHELSVIKNSGFASYFLIVSDFVRFAKEKGIPVGPGRGSAAGSIVSYLLGITEIDPLKYDLLFERFLNPERVSFPDIDIDFCYERRDEVIKYVSEKYGSDNVAQIITFGTMAAKGVIRDVGRVLGMPYAEVDKLAKLIPVDPNITLSDAISVEPELKRLYHSDKTIKKLVDTALVLEGLSRHASTHAAGVVISDKPLYEHIPLFRSTDGQTTTGYTMKSLEKIGLLKMDFLGLKTLTIISETLKIIKRTKGINLDINKIPLDEPKTFELFCKAKTLGVFQVESSGMRDLLKKLKPDKFEEIIALLALYRPGPLGSGMVDDFIKRKHSVEKVRYDHPLLEPVLKDTYGIILYQEQVMRISNVLAGFSLAQADVLRRAMGKKIPEVIENLKKSFIDGAVYKGIKKNIAEKVFGLIEFFAGYGFNKSHSAAYALISYQTAFLKANYPVEFMAALLTGEKDNTDKIALYINECKHMRIKILPPDINESFAQFTVVSDNSIRFGLSAIKNVGQGAVESIIRARKEGDRFTSLLGLCKRVDSKATNKKVIESLIKCGAFDSLKINRAQLIANMESIISLAGSLQKDKQSGQMLLFEGSADTNSQEPKLSKVEEWPLLELLSYEKTMLGFYITAHPLDQYKKLLKRYSLLSTADIYKKAAAAEDVAVAGIIEKIKTTITKKKAEKMAIIRLEDTESSLEVLVFPEVYKQTFMHLRQDGVVVVKGKLDYRENSPKIIASDVIPIESVSRVMVESLNLSISPLDLKQKIFYKIKDIIQLHPGKTPIHLAVSDKEGKRVKIQANTCVEVSNTLISELEKILGKEDVLVKMKR